MKAHVLRSIFLAAALAAIGGAAFAADVGVDRLELLSIGSVDESTGALSVDTHLFFDLSFKGGDKFGGLLRMELLSSDVEQGLGLINTPATPGNYLDKLNNLTSMGFHTAAVTAKRLFGTGLEASYFVGYLDTFCSGDDFVPLFGAAPFGTILSGPMAFPNGIGNGKYPNVFYDGLDEVNGTGLRLGMAGGTTAGYFYAYQDADIGDGAWSSVLRGLLDTGPLKLEAYAGASYTPSTLYGLYRGGCLFDYAPGAVGEFFAQVGLTRWDPAAALNIGDFFFLFEPRINFNPGSLIVTVFYHPAWYYELATDEQNALDLNINLKIGDVSRSGSQGGLMALLSFRPQQATALSVDVTPYFSAIASGMEWDLKLDLRVFPLPTFWYGIFQPFIGVTTSF